MSGGDDKMTPLAAGREPGAHLEPEELMAYALELLPEEERAGAAAHLDGGAGCEVCRENLAAMRDDLGIFALAETPAVEPPSESRARLLAGIIGVAQEKSATAGRRAPEASPAGEVSGLERAPVSESASAPASLGLLDGGRASAPLAPKSRVPAWLGWGVAAAISLIAAHFYQDREALRRGANEQSAEITRLSSEQARARAIVSALTDPAAQRVTLSLTKAPAPPQPSGRATYLPGRGTLIFLASHLEALPAGKTYELWVIPANGSAPVAVGLFKPDVRGSASVVTAKLGQSPEAKAFGITIEPEGGSPSPTMPIVLAGS